MGAELPDDIVRQRIAGELRQNAEALGGIEKSYMAALLTYAADAIEEMMTEAEEEKISADGRGELSTEPDYWTRLYHQAVLLNRAALLSDPEYGGSNEKADMLSRDATLETIARLKGESRMKATKEAEVCNTCGTDERDMARLTRERDEARGQRDAMSMEIARANELANQARTDAARLQGALERAERKLTAYVGVCKGDKELTETVLPMARAALAGEGARQETQLDCCKVHVWTCKCGRTVCSNCEGAADNQPDDCDHCWVDPDNTPEKAREA